MDFCPAVIISFDERVGLHFQGAEPCASIEEQWITSQSFDPRINILRNMAGLSWRDVQDFFEEDSIAKDDVEGQIALLRRCSEWDPMYSDEDYDFLNYEDVKPPQIPPFGHYRIF
jgi:hypothetical protein